MKTTWRWPVRDATAQNPIKPMESIRRHAAKSRSFILVAMTGMSISPYPDLSDHELKELEETYIQEMRDEGLLRPTLIKPGENKSEQRW